jgi:hypothetical protein
MERRSRYIGSLRSRRLVRAGEGSYKRKWLICWLCNEN